MKTKTILKLLRKKDKEVELIEDSPTSFRIFIYTQRQKFPITTFIDRLKFFKIERISDYPKQKQHYPICVMKVNRLHKSTKHKKRK